MARALRGGRRALLAAALVAAGAAACDEFGTGVGEIGYIAFDGVPWPSLVAGDTMRDSLGVATPLRASAYDAAGRLIPDAAFTYLLLDTGAVIDADGTLRATTRRDGTLRVVASLNGLQTADQLIRVTRRPDSAFAAAGASQTLRWVLPDGSANTSTDLRLALVSGDSIGVPPGVGGWIVRWRTVHDGDTFAPGDTSLAVLQGTGGARGAVDTTTAEGTATRRLRVFAGRIPAPVDSFIVLAEVRRWGAPVPGSPVRFVVNIAPTTTP